MEKEKFLQRLNQLIEEGRVLTNESPTVKKYKPKVERDFMLIAIPIANDILCMHFGHCEKFRIFKVDPEAKKVISIEDADPPAHEPGVLPRWLGEKGVNVIIAGGMGQRAQVLFTEQNINVIIGTAGSPDELVNKYMTGELQSGENFCDH